MHDQTTAEEASGEGIVRIERIVCRNLRAVADLDLEVRDHMALVGPNASGKTSLLRTLDVVLNGSFGQLVNAFAVESLRDAEQPLEVMVQFTGFSDDERAALSDEINVTGSGDSKVESLTLSATVTFDGDEPQVARVFTKPGEDRRVKPEHLAAIGWGYLPATRSPERSLGAGRRSALRLLVGSLDLGAARVELQSLLEDANVLLDSAAPVVELRRLLAKELSDVLPQPVASDDLSVTVTSGANDEPAGGAEVRLKAPSGEPVPLHRQSDGLSAMSTIVVQRLATPAAILAVDEPEIHLHPRSQARLGHLLATGPGQRIVATHSSPVLCSFKPTEAVALAIDGARQLDPDLVAANPKVFSRWWMDSTLEPLTAASVALVEGPSDRVLLLRTASLLGKDLDHLACSVVVMHGLDALGPMWRLYGPSGFGLSLRGLVDLDAVPKVASTIGAAADPVALRATGWEVSEPDLEGECVAGLGVERHAELMCASGHFTEQQILGATKATTIADIDAASYTGWLRSGGTKMVHAVALSTTMERTDAELIKSLAALTNAVAG